MNGTSDAVEVPAHCRSAGEQRLNLFDAPTLSRAQVNCGQVGLVREKACDRIEKKQGRLLALERISRCVLQLLDCYIDREMVARRKSGQSPLHPSQRLFEHIVGYDDASAVVTAGVRISHPALITVG